MQDDSAGPVAGAQRAPFEVPAMRENRDHAMKAALPKKTACRDDHDFVNLLF
jgi:hypothetical protein